MAGPEAHRQLRARRAAARPRARGIEVCTGCSATDCGACVLAAKEAKSAMAIAAISTHTTASAIGNSIFLAPMTILPFSSRYFIVVFLLAL